MSTNKTLDRKHFLEESLRWALSKVTLPLVPCDGGVSQGCPGCGKVWFSGMVHLSDCEYIKATQRIAALSQPVPATEESKERDSES